MENPPALIDSHLHLDLINKDESIIDETLDEARRAGVQGFLTVATQMNAEYRQFLRRQCQRHNDVWLSVGVHPNHAGEEPIDNPQKILDVIAQENPEHVVAIGESGLDKHYDYASPKAQRTSFVAHIRAAQESGMPLIIHNREANREIQQVLEEEYDKAAFNMVLHSFTGDAELLRSANKMKSYISFSGIVTFRSAKDLQALAREVDVSRILVETDAPYLAPTPMRGKRNQPAFVQHTLAFVAQLRGDETETLAKQTTDNFFTLFNKAKIRQKS